MPAAGRGVEEAKSQGMASLGWAGMWQRAPLEAEDAPVDKGALRGGRRGGEADKRAKGGEAVSTIDDGSSRCFGAICQATLTLGAVSSSKGRQPSHLQGGDRPQRLPRLLFGTAATGGRPILVVILFYFFFSFREGRAWHDLRGMRQWLATMAGSSCGSHHGVAEGGGLRMSQGGVACWASDSVCPPSRGR